MVSMSTHIHFDQGAIQVHLILHISAVKGKLV